MRKIFKSFWGTEYLVTKDEIPIARAWRIPCLNVILGASKKRLTFKIGSRSNNADGNANGKGVNKRASLEE